MAVESWEEKAQVARDYRDASLAKVEPPLAKLPDPLPENSLDLPKQFLTEREYTLTQDYDAIALLGMLRSKSVTSEELTRAFLRRAALAQQAVNCVTELMWDDAIARAKYLDSLPEPAGPLHGLPISIKEHHGMQGKGVHANFVAWIGHQSDESQINNILYNAGCVFYVRTTGPQALMHLECTNNIYGRTVNPHNRNLTSGGSSGGEGALVAFRGSVLGVGGDIGGSVRNPAANNGIYGFKPTCKRVPVSGFKMPMAGIDSVAVTFGPLCSSRQTLDLFMRTVIDAQPSRLDASLVPWPWSPVSFSKPLKVAIMWDDGVVNPHPPITRALKEVAAACAKAGMEVVDWVPYDHRKAWDIITELYFPDGGKEVLDLIKSSGEPVHPLTKFIIEEQPTVKDHSITEYWALCAKRDAYRNEYAVHWSSTATNSPDGREVDLIIAPTNPGVAPPHDTARYWCYTSQWNLLDYPAAVWPVTTVDSSRDVREANYVPRNGFDKFNHGLYADPSRYEGMPVNLQIIGRRFHDEKVLAGLEAVEKAMGRV